MAEALKRSERVNKKTTQESEGPCPYYSDQYYELFGGGWIYQGPEVQYGGQLRGDLNRTVIGALEHACTVDELATYAISPAQVRDYCLKTNGACYDCTRFPKTDEPKN